MIVTLTLASTIWIVIGLTISNLVFEGLLEAFFRRDEYWYKSVFSKSLYQISGIIFFIAVLYLTQR